MEANNRESKKGGGVLRQQAQCYYPSNTTTTSTTNVQGINYGGTTYFQQTSSTTTTSTTTRRNSNPTNQNKPRRKPKITPKITPKPPPQAPKRNGEKGAEAHTVSENQRIHLTKILLQFRDNDPSSEMEFAKDLTNTERKFLHLLCLQLGLKSKSYGKGENRRIIISKMTQRSKKTAETSDDDLPLLTVGDKGTEALIQHVQSYPDENDSYSESSSSSDIVLENNDTDDVILTKLNDLGLTEEGIEKTPPPTPKKSQGTRNVLQMRRKSHYKAQQRKNFNSRFEGILKKRKELPVFQYRDAICESVQNCPVTFIIGDTGCGKSTQIPQFLIDNPNIGPTANILVTQPRRISAMMLAERVSYERCETVGDTVGYTIRLETHTSRNTQITFVTPGILLQMMGSSPNLREFSHIVLDEVHERDRYTEFLVIRLRQMIEGSLFQKKKPEFGLILMSATFQTREWVEYWTMGDFRPKEIVVPGRMFPVQEFYLEDVLTMTNYLDYFQSMEGNDLELKLKQLTAKKGSGGNHGLVCAMCRKGGFRCAEELGTHVAMCTGNTTDYEALENRLRQTDNGAVVQTSSSPAFYDKVSSMLAVAAEEEDGGDDSLDDDIVEEKPPQDLENPLFQLIDNISSQKSTLTEEEMLNQYHTLHDDDQIDYDLLFQLLLYIVDSSYGDGAILLFFPGWNEISEFQILLEGSPPLNDTTRFLILPLHSGIPSKDQRRVFSKTKQRKIILSTNIAETSVTVDDVAFVVDTGKAKEKNYDPHLKTSTLTPTWISRSSAEQRKGRAGRTKPGVCFRLFSHRRYDSFRPFLESELLRTPLEEICLSCKRLGLAPGSETDEDGIPAFLGKALSPPHPKSISNALELLIELGAMEPHSNTLTDLGQCLSVLSLEPRVGKMLIWSYILGVAEPACTMAVAMSYKSPFTLPPLNLRQAADRAMVTLSQYSESDLITILNTLKMRDDIVKKRGSSALYTFCKNNFLNVPTLQMLSDLRRHVSKELMSIGFPSPFVGGGAYPNRHSKQIHPAFLQATIAAGLYPNIAFRTQNGMNFSTRDQRKAKIHIGSVNSCKGQPLNLKCRNELEFVAFGEMVRGVSSFTLSQTTYLASPMPLLLLCGNSLKIRPSESSGMSILSVDDWILFQCDTYIARALVTLRKRLDATFLHVVSNPSGFEMTDAERDAVDVLGIVLMSSFDRCYMDERGGRSW